MCEIWTNFTILIGFRGKIYKCYLFSELAPVSSYQPSFKTSTSSLVGQQKFIEVPKLGTTCITQSIHGNLTSRSFIMYSLEPDCTDVALCETRLPPGRLQLNSAWTGALDAAEKSGATHLQPVACTVCPRVVRFIKQMMNWKIHLKWW